MMKKLVTLLCVGVIGAAVVACGSSKEAAEEISVEATETTEATEGLANPWEESSKEEISEVVGGDMEPLEEATDAQYLLNLDEGIGEMSFNYLGAECVARVKTTEELEDISGMNYDNWETEAVEIGEIKGEFKATKDGDNTVQVINLYDPSTEISYSLSAVGKDLDGMDIQGLAEGTFQW